MTTNKPGTVAQRPLFGCANCYEDFSYPAYHLHVYNGECWCEICWEEATHEIADGLDWCELEPFKPALQAECEKLRKDAERYRCIRKGNQWIVAATQTGFHVDGEELDGLIDRQMEE